MPTTRSFFSPFESNAARKALVDSVPFPVSYGVNENLLEQGGEPTMLDDIQYSTEAIFIAPARTGSNTYEGMSTMNLTVNATSGTEGTWRSGRNINVLFLDMHAKTITWKQFTEDGDEFGKRRWALD